MRFLVAFLFAALVATAPALAAVSRDMSITGAALQFVPASDIIAGQKIRIYSTVHNLGVEDLIGTVKFFVDGAQIATDQPVSVKQGSIPDEVFIIWQALPGQHTVTAQIFPYEREGDNPGNNVITGQLFVDWDTDGDGVGNLKDTDDDNDGLSDTEEQQLGTSPGKPDTDGDGVGDKSDAFPLDSSEQRDTDGDGIGDNADTDDDNDGLPDTAELALGTLPDDADTDGDTCNDLVDLFPLDGEECTDSDRDGVGDGKDAFPNDATESVDCDGDGVGNNADPDDDNDGVLDADDAFPCDAAEQNDCDLDGIGDNADTDDDNDGHLDTEDAFICDATEWRDSDGDGLGDNADPNDANQGPLVKIAGERKAYVGVEFALDGGESLDTDGQVVGYTWDFGDGSPSQSEPTATHIYDKVGEYTVQLTVTDDAGESRTLETKIFVENSPWLEQLLLVIFLILLLLLALAFYRTARERAAAGVMHEVARKVQQHNVSKRK